MSAIVHAWSILNKKQKRSYVLLLFIVLVGAFFELIGVAALLPLLQLLLAPEKVMNHEMISGIIQTLHIASTQEVVVLMLVAIIAVYIIKNLYLIWMAYMRYRIVWSSRLEVEKEILNYYVNQPYEYYTYSNPSEMQRVILTDVGNVFSTVESVLVLFSETLSSALILLYLVITDVWTTGAIVLVASLFMLLYFKVFKRRLYQYGKIMQAKGAEVSRNIYNIFHCVKEIKVYGREGFFTGSFSKNRAQQISMMKRSAFWPQVPKYFMEMICVAGALAILLFKTLEGGDVNALVAQIGVLAVAAYKIMPTINHINISLSTLTVNKASIELVYVLKQECAQQKHSETVSEPEGVKTDQKDIVFEHVSFQYSNTEKFILEDVSFTIHAGQAVGFIGASGAGKTTTVDLLLGILKPTKGRILYGGQDIEHLGKSWSAHLGYIPQIIYLSDDSLRVNVAFGIENPEDEKIWNALREAQLYDFVKESEEGLDSTMGEGGIRFSGGQRQRVGIARALYHDPDILVLDEATSALDNDTEKAVMESINYLQGRKTLIIIAHRLSTIENCDVIYEVKDGKVVERKR